MKHTRTLLCLLAVWITGQHSFAQTLQDDFSDGNITTNPTWLGNTSSFTVNSASQLQLYDNVAANSTRYLSVAAATSRTDSTTWEFYAQEIFSPSTTNYARVYLAASASDLTGSLNGYYVKLGGITGATDALELYQQTGTTSTLLATGTASAMGGTTARARVRVTRSTSGTWKLYADYTGGTNYALEATVSDTTHNLLDYFGVYCVFTSTRDTNFIFDDIRITPLYMDNIVPSLVSASAASSTQVDVRFSEALNASSANTAGNYIINNGINVTSAAIDALDPTLVHLTVGGLTNGTTYQLNVRGVQDLANNAITNDSTSFTYIQLQAAAFQDIVINEVFADPSPQVGLPNFEYIELYNRSNKYIDLANYTLYEGTTHTLPTHILTPNGYVLLCLASAVDSFPMVSNKIGLASLSLTNAGELLRLSNSSGIVIDSVHYADTWYQDAVKKNGGWSLELINPNLLCKGESNWIASNDATGGTPARQNSVFNTTPDTQAPDFVSATYTSSSQIVLVFNDVLDATAAQNPANYTISNTTVTQAVYQYPFTVLLTINPLFVNGDTYTITVQPSLTDCAGNAISAQNSKTFTYYDVLPAQLQDIIFNEMMIDETPSQGLPLAEYIELYNRSNHAISLQGFKLAHRSASSSSTTSVTLPAYTMLPNEYVLLHNAADTFWTTISNKVSLTGFPSLNNTGAYLHLYDVNNTVVDSLFYTSGWYRNSNKADGGWSLELINPEELCKGSMNWAASVAPNGGTPAVQNSIYTTVIDNTPPALVSIQTVNNLSVTLAFDEIVDVLTGSNPANYTFTGGLTVTNASVYNLNNVLITFATPMQHLTGYTVTVNSVEDCVGNALMGATKTFTYYETQSASRYDVIINEIFPDIDPSIGLPRKEFVELYNRSNKYINLAYYTIEDAAGGVGVLPNYVLAPNAYLVLCSSDDTIGFSQFGNFLFVDGFPDLNVSSETLTLRDNISRVIDAVAYTPDWFGNSSKSEGGWTLERINYNKPCDGQSNWAASNNMLGGTPCQPNSTLQTSADAQSPDAIRAYPTAANTVTVYFSEALTPSLSNNPASYSIDNGINIVAATTLEPFFNTVELTLDAPLQPSVTYTVTIANTFSDCVGNTISQMNTVRVALPQLATTNDVIINEVLFNPVTGGSDFVELYNRSSKPIDVQTFIFANADASGNISQTKTVGTPYILFPQEFVVVTPSVINTKQQYNVSQSYKFIQNDLPTYDDASGTVWIYSTASGAAVDMDKFIYNKSYHHPLLTSEEGVSLERISYEGGTNDPNNWHSAASNVQYGTPTYVNSSYMGNATASDAAINLPTDKLSPDNDGFQDFLLINYNVDKLGYVARVTIYDASGRVIRNLTDAELFALEGSLQWDGTDNDGKKAFTGIYVIYIELVNPDGTIKSFKKTCVVASKL